MHKRLFGILIALALLTSAIDAYADVLETMDYMSEKFKRGLINTLTGWAEFPLQIAKGFTEGFGGDADSKLLGAAWGIVEGIGHSVGRTLSGVTDLVGFWAANPEDNHDVGIPLDAEYAWQTGVPYDPFDPNFTDAAIRPMVNKFLRGGGNAIFGFMEIPNQIKKGISEKAPDYGVFKGLWYWVSREVSGISDTVSAPFPNPEDATGVYFDEKWPWDKVTEEYQPSPQQ